MEIMVKKKGLASCCKLYCSSDDETIRTLAGNILLLYASSAWMPAVIEQGGELLLKRLVYFQYCVLNRNSLKIWRKKRIIRLDSLRLIFYNL
jgi:hypothetical protein